MGASGNGRKWELAEAGVGASGNGRKRKWAWAQVGITRKRRYFALSTAAHADLARATVELRQMFVAATDHILQQDESSEVRQPEQTCTHARAHAHAHTHARTRTRAHAGTEAVSTAREALVTPPQISRHEVCLPTSAPGLGSPLPHPHQERAHPCPHLCREWACPCHILPGLGSFPPHLHWNCAHCHHICIRSGLTPVTSVLPLGPPLPHLHRD